LHVFSDIIKASLGRQGQEACRMTEKMALLKKKLKALNAGLKAFKDALKVRETSLSRARTFSSKAVQSLSSATLIDPIANEILSAAKGLLEELETQVQRERGRMVTEIALRIKEEMGFSPEGNLPVIYAGPYALEFTFVRKPLCTIYLGPKKEKLGVVEAQNDTVISKLKEVHASLYPLSFDEEGFLKGLFGAYKVVLARLGRRDGERVPVTALLAEFAFAQQKKSFLCDPKKELFTTYSRAHFAVALSRLKSRTYKEREFRMTVATMSQTKDPKDFLFVPKGLSTDGTHFSEAWFESKDDKGGIL
jgi:hypothetical protein